MGFKGKNTISRAVGYMAWTLLMFHLVACYGFPAFSQDSGIVSENASPGQAQNDTADAVSKMTDIHDIKPIERPGFDPRLLYFALLGFFILSVLGFAFQYWRKRRKEKLLANAETVTPEEAALIALDEIAGYHGAQGKKFYFRLSAILRTYIQGRYGINAPEMTTEEFLPRLDELGLDKEMKKNLKDFVCASDPIKFADMPADEASMKSDLTFVKTFVKKTTPVMDPGSIQGNGKIHNTNQVHSHYAEI